MSTTAFVGQYVMSLASGAVFATRDLLNFGRRGAVDQALYRLIKRCAIVRLCRGLFMKSDGCVAKPSVFEVAKAKAKAFQRSIFVDGQAAARRFTFNKQSGAEETEQTVFATDGPTTSFKYGAVRIVLRRVSPRKLEKKDTELGVIIRGLWALGQLGVTQSVLHQTVGQLGRAERAMLRKSIAAMPQWLAEKLHR